MVTVSVIGCGNMGSAVVKGLADTGHSVTAYDVDESALDAVAEYAAETTTDLGTAAAAPVVVLAVKPGTVTDVLAELDLSPDQTLVSVAAGVETEVIEPRTDARVVRVMPNLAAEFGEMAAAATPPDLDDDVSAVLDDLGTVVGVEEERMHLATALNGSGPAFVFYLIAAMGKAGENAGLDPEAAERLAAQTFKGAAETVLRADEDVETLIDAVCSPNGTTVEGMAVLRDSDVEAVLDETLRAAERRSEEIADEVEHDRDEADGGNA
ncbi:MAG: pyrroline-5-carboxylate reductase [Haloarculaceae archaeon]